MPPKKVVEEEKLGPWALGRFSSNLKVRRKPPSASFITIARAQVTQIASCFLARRSDGPRRSSAVTADGGDAH
tara:strand:+ start:243 stop:461 length:219 start_codon:yes stop_codon:yes gene_type:complete